MMNAIKYVRRNVVVHIIWSLAYMHLALLRLSRESKRCCEWLISVVAAWDRES